MAGEAQSVSRREAMKTALKGSAYASPVVLGALVPPAVAAASPVPPTPVSFAPAPGSPFAVGDGPNGIMVADFNGDNKPDLAVVSEFGNSVSVLLGNGGGGFTNAPGSPITVQFNPDGIAVGDFNGDGKPDIAVINEGSTVNLLLDSGGGSFTNASGSPFALGNGPSGIAVGDFNRDGKLDFAVTNARGNTVSVLLQR